MPDLKPLVDELVSVSNNMLAIQTEISTRVAEFQNQLADAQAKDTQLREAIRLAMESSGQTEPYEDNNIKITYVKPSERVSVDMDRLRIEEPEIAAKYKKVTTVRSSVRIGVK